MRRRMVWELAACFAAVLLLFTAVLGGVYAAAFRRHTVAVNREAMEVQAASIAGTLASFGGYGRLNLCGTMNELVSHLERGL